MPLGRAVRGQPAGRMPLTGRHVVRPGPQGKTTWQSASPSGGDRYSRQSRFWGIGPAGQQRIRAGHVVVIGCGALGSAGVNLLARAGVGRITIVDRDFVELSNLQRQLLFDEADAAAGLPKAIAAARAVARINSEVEVRPVVADVTPANVEELVAAADVVLDGTDNFETRYLRQRRLREAGHPLGLRRRGRVDGHVDDHRARRDRLLPVPLPRAADRRVDGDVRDGRGARRRDRHRGRDPVCGGDQAPGRRPREPQPRADRRGRLDERPPPGRGHAPRPRLPVLRPAAIRVPGRASPPAGRRRSAAATRSR